MIGPDGEVSLRLPAQPRFVRLARLIGAGLADELGFDLEGLDDVRLAIGEVCDLAVQAEADSIDLRYVVAPGSLVVAGTAQRSATALPNQVVDEGHLVLVKQILDVACGEHELTRTGDVVTFTLTFAHGR